MSQEEWKKIYDEIQNTVSIDDVSQILKRQNVKKILKIEELSDDLIFVASTMMLGDRFRDQLSGHDGINGFTSLLKLAVENENQKKEIQKLACSNFVKQDDCKVLKKHVKSEMENKFILNKTWISNPSIHQEKEIIPDAILKDIEKDYKRRGRKAFIKLTEEELIKEPKSEEEIEEEKFHKIEEKYNIITKPQEINLSDWYYLKNSLQIKELKEGEKSQEEIDNIINKMNIVGKNVIEICNLVKESKHGFNVDVGDSDLNYLNSGDSPLRDNGGYLISAEELPEVIDHVKKIKNKREEIEQILKNDIKIVPYHLFKDEKIITKELLNHSCFKK